MHQVLASLALLLGCVGAAPPDEPSPPTSGHEVTPAEAGPAQGPPLPFGPPQALPPVSAPFLNESSGLAPSQRHPGSFWTHNDSGNPAELFRVDLEGHLLGRHPVPGLDNRDWEDLAAGPCPGLDEPCLFIAEIGDNKKRYEWVAVYAVREPAGDEPAGIVATWRARYPDGARNAEALLRDPRTGRLWLVTKEGSGQSEVYRFPEQPSEAPGLLERVASLTIQGDSEAMRKVTGGDFSPDGRRLLLRGYVVAWEWDVHQPDRHAHWSEEPRVIWLAPEEQGEAITYDSSGGVITSSEGVPMTMQRVPRAGSGSEGSPERVPSTP